MEKTLVSASQLDAMMKSEPTVIIDTRDPQDYAQGHIPGAVNVRDIFSYLATSDEAGMAELNAKFAGLLGDAGLGGAETAVIYEDSMDSGYGQSCRGYFLLKYLGYPKVCVLHGGLKAWTDAGMELSTAAATPAPKEFPLDVNEKMMVTTEQMFASLAKPEVVKLDVRDLDEWMGESSSPYGVDYAPRKGRIPDAVLIEWYAMMKPSGAVPMFKSNEEILEIARSVGIEKETPVIIYCFKGARASNTLVALNEAGIMDTSIYFASWNEWSRDASLPIEEGAPDPMRPAVAVTASAMA